ncbi:type I restriction endonuclease subunit S [Rhizobium leguminosarum]|uniref:restriction endonuclease subunit S n=1 Tax=Rhizobium leguminosarum TaxID=384 RepID=UPI0010321CF0|nr:restriction endonuclease subunit S [Rhizobium leguminosarum]TAV12589.1 type I restriction endonuclease subunit S [Rhizobium leguminosarum]
MNAERLLQHYEQIADASDAIARLRRFILDLAVRGKLVPQNPADEPASELLKRIAAEKARLVDSGEIKTEKPIKQAFKSEEKYCLPTLWLWADLQAVCLSITDGDHLPPPKADKGVPFLVIGDVRDKTINYDCDRYVGRAYYEKLDHIRRPRKGDILYTLVGSFGIPVPVQDNREFCVQRHIGILRPSEIPSVRFLTYTLESNLVFNQAEKFATGIAQKTVPLAGLRAIQIPLPPLAEQHRIVAKVDELMALCDTLEAARTERETKRDRLAAASLARLNTPDPETFPDDARFALDALPALTARPDQIKQLRQTILNLAVRGKLVPQDAAEEPVKELLRRIEADRQMVRRKVETEVAAKSGPFDLPGGWMWTTIGSVCSKTGSGSTPRGGKEVYVDHGIPFLRSQNVHDDGLRLNDVAYIAPEVHLRMAGTAVKASDLLLNITGGSMGRCCRVPDQFGEANISQHVAIIRPVISIMAHYLHCLVLSPYFQAFIFDEQTGAGRGGLPKNRMDQIAVPLPPLAEQHRIVSKVDELMALCDQLETSLTSADGTRKKLLDALLAEALAPVDAEKLREAAE